jgi:hypothetical protein
MPVPPQALPSPTQALLRDHTMNNTNHPKTHLAEPRGASGKNPWSLTKTRPTGDAVQMSAEVSPSSLPKTPKR